MKGRNEMSRHRKWVQECSITFWDCSYSSPKLIKKLTNFALYRIQFIRTFFNYWVFFFCLILDFSGINPIFCISKMIAIHITTVTALQNWHLQISGKIVKTLINFKRTYIFHFYKLNCSSFEVHNQISFKLIYILLSFYI